MTKMEFREGPERKKRTRRDCSKSRISGVREGLSRVISLMRILPIGPTRGCEMIVEGLGRHECTYRKTQRKQEIELLSLWRKMNIKLPNNLR